MSASRPDWLQRNSATASACSCYAFPRPIFTTWRYASAVFAVIVCPSVCLSARPSVRHKPVLYQNDWTNRAGFWYGGFLTLIPYCDISRNYGTSLWILELCFKLRTWKISPGQVIRVVNVVDGRACWRHLYDNRRVVAVSYKSNNCNPLTPLLRFVVDLLYNLFLQFTRCWLTQRVARSVCSSKGSYFKSHREHAWNTIRSTLFGYYLLTIYNEIHTLHSTNTAEKCIFCAQ